MSKDETYFIIWKGRRDGPYSLGQLEELLENGDVGLLHRVETPSGQVTLKQLLQEAEPARRSIPTSMPATSPDISTSGNSLAATSQADEQEAIRAYTICGLCFLLPPLAFWTWKIAGGMAAQGHESMAKKLKLLSSSLSAGGLLMWILLWRFW